MARKKEITAEKIIELYMSTLLLDNEVPKTVYAFAHANNFEESEFYKYFSSFEVLEKNIFSLFCENTLALLIENKDYPSYEPINKLLTFYYTFFEMLSANRSFVYLKLAQNKNKLEALKLLSKLRVTFLKYIEAEIYTDVIDLKNKTLNSISPQPPPRPPRRRPHPHPTHRRHPHRRRRPHRRRHHAVRRAARVGGEEAGRSLRSRRARRRPSAGYPPLAASAGYPPRAGSRSPGLG